MKRLAVFCDGTWNDLRMPHLTNVARLAKCVRDCTDDDVRQVVYYDSGVGVSAQVSRLADLLIRMTGGAFGRGLDEKIENAYRFLVLNYEPGDEIYVFGFSRGAYTARSLCGLVRKCGILRREKFDQIPQAVRLYRDRKTAPHEVNEFRLSNAHRWPHARKPVKGSNAPRHPIATGKEDLPEAERQAVWAQRFSFERDPPAEHGSWRIYKLMYLGVWDTVGALGVPARLPWLARLVNRKYRFHDTDASSLITSLRHAASIDEDRWTFDITPVSNIDRLNREWGHATGAEVDDDKAAKFVPYEARPFQQRWFPGDHGAVGGGNPEPGLSSGALIWIAEGAQARGLQFNDDAESEIGLARRLQNPLAEWRIDKEGRGKSRWAFDLLGLAGGYRSRRGPLLRDEVHETAWERLAKSDDYRPSPLRRFTGKARAAAPYRLLALVLFPPFVLVMLLAAVALVSFLALALGAGAGPAVDIMRDWVSEACQAIKGSAAR